jgi:hypothetical protein
MVMNEIGALKIQTLLDTTGSIIEKYMAISRETGSDFNIFEIADISTKEVVICRVLCEILSPAGSHGQKGIYLEIFLRDCLGMDFSKSEIDSAIIHREYVIDEGRRIDLAIEIEGRFIPIEIKIYAQDQETQCYAYLKFAKAKDETAKIVYLTLYGDDPSEYSKALLEEKDIIKISFANHILCWIEKCLALQDTIRKAPIREIFIQFAAAIKRITNQLEDKPKMEIVELLSQSSQNMRNANAIVNSFETCRTKITKKLFEAIEKRLESEKRLKRVYYSDKYMYYDYKAMECVEYFQHPGINYIVVDKTIDNYNITFRIEIDSNLYCGFGLEKNGKHVEDCDTLCDKRVIGLFSDDIINTNSNWWICWEYIDYEGNHINFKQYNDNYFKLFDKDKFDEIVNSAILQINAVLNKLKCQRDGSIDNVCIT